MPRPAPLTLYELRLDDGRSHSPYVWRARMALAHKGLAADLVGFSYGDNAVLAPSGQGRVPVLRDGERWIANSWAIACHLEDAHPDAPSLFGGAAGRGQCLFVNRWADTVQLPAIARITVPATYDRIPAPNKAYFHDLIGRSMRVPIDALRGDPASSVAAIRAIMLPIRQTLRAQPYICGHEPGYADYVVFGGFQWARVVSDQVLLAPDDPVHAWRHRLLERFDGLAGKAPGQPIR